MRSDMRVLLIEDDGAVRVAVADVLTDQGVVVDAVSNAEDALVLLGSGQVCDVLVTDINLGAGLDGLALADSLRSRYPEIAVVFVSGRPMAPDGISPRDRFLAKPFTPLQLVAAIEQLARRPLEAF